MKTFSARAPAPDAHARLHGDFRWPLPARFNIADVCCGRAASRSPGSTRTAAPAR
jgi:acetyl-CoA synthetase